MKDRVYKHSAVIHDIHLHMTCIYDMIGYLMLISHCAVPGSFRSCALRLSRQSRGKYKNCLAEDGETSANQAQFIYDYV